MDGLHEHQGRSGLSLIKFNMTNFRDDQMENEYYVSTLCLGVIWGLCNLLSEQSRIHTVTEMEG
eukprot:5850561-Pyramimonas_sp.AAC.1